MLLARLRLLLARRPWIYWCLAVLLAALAAWALRSAAAAADRERRRWGSTRTVWVTDSPTARGERIDAVARDVPVALVPDDAVDGEPSHPAAHPLGRGQIVVTGDLARSPPSSSDTVSIAIDNSHVPLVVPGERITLIGDGALLCTGTVDRVSDETIDVRVTTECVAAASRHLLDGSIVMARGP